MHWIHGEVGRSTSLRAGWRLERRRPARNAEESESNGVSELNPTQTSGPVLSARQRTDLRRMEAEALAAGAASRQAAAAANAHTNEERVRRNNQMGSLELARLMQEQSSRQQSASRQREEEGLAAEADVAVIARENEERVRRSNQMTTDMEIARLLQEQEYVNWAQEMHAMDNPEGRQLPPDLGNIFRTRDSLSSMVDEDFQARAFDGVFHESSAQRHDRLNREFEQTRSQEQNTSLSAMQVTSIPLHCPQAHNICGKEC